MNLNRRSLLKLSAATMAAGTIGLPTFAQAIDELVIAYNVNLPSWDPTVGPSAVNPTKAMKSSKPASSRAGYQSASM